MPNLNEAAFSAFHARHARDLWGYVYRVTSHAADADDIVQEAFLRLLRSGPDTDDDEQLRRFLFRVASNLMVDRWRRQKSEESRAIGSRTTGSRTTGSRTIKVRAATDTEACGADLYGPRAADDGPRDRDVARTFAQLTRRDRALLWLAYVEEESHEMIAASLGVGRRSIKVLLFRAKRRLRNLLHAKGLAST